MLTPLVVYLDSLTTPGLVAAAMAALAAVSTLPLAVSKPPLAASPLWCRGAR